MPLPQTLLQMAGAPSEPAPLAESTVVMIDCQREYVDGKLALPGVAPALDQGAALLDKARTAGAPVIHVQHRSPAGAALFDPDGPYYAIDDRVAPREGERSVTKALPNAFAGTDLQAILGELGRKRLVVAGFMTHMCVSSTVRAALDLGYQTTVVGGACATRDLPDGRGGVVEADALHRAELAALSDRFAVIAPDAAAF